MSKPSDLIQGTLDLLILKTVALEPRHGWAIAKRIQQVSGDVLLITQGSLYPALHRLEQQGWLKAQAGRTDTGRDGKFYALTRPAAGSWRASSRAGTGCRRRSAWWCAKPSSGSSAPPPSISEHRMSRTIDKVRLRLASLFRAGNAEQSLKQEIALHLQEQIDEYVAAGMTPAEARAAALRAFGSPGLVEEQCRDTRRVAFVEHLVQDLRYTLRSLVRQPLLLAAAVLSIGVAIAANTTIFSLASQLLFAKPSAVRPDRLVHIRIGGGSHVSHRQWRALDERQALGGLTGFNIETAANWRGPERTVNLISMAVAGNFFDVVGVPMELGRGFTAREAQAELDPAVVVISHRFWEQRLAKDPAVIGSSLVFNGRPYTVTGVIAEGARSIAGFGLAPEVYLPVGRTLMPDFDSTGPSRRFSSSGVCATTRRWHRRRAALAAAGEAVAVPGQRRARGDHALRAGRLDRTVRQHGDRRRLLRDAPRGGRADSGDRLRECRRPAARAGRRSGVAKSPFAWRSARAAGGSHSSCWSRASGSPRSAPSPD